MQVFRRHVIVRFFVCVLLTWTAVDLLVPQLCEAEELSQASTSDQSVPTPEANADCFCCSHVVDPVMIAVVLVDGGSVDRDDFSTVDLTPGVPRSLYHPPLTS